MRAQAVIDRKALRHNLVRVREAAPGSRVLAVIKANGYGHGAVRVAQALTDADAFAVACVSEAQELRAAGIMQPLVLLEGVFSPKDLQWASLNRCECVVHTGEQVELLESTAPEWPVTVWLKVDSGMHRLGVVPGHATKTAARLRACDAVGGVRLMTHLACADDRADSTTERQLQTFDRAVSTLDAEHSIANSAAVLAWPASHRDWVRPGIMLYGSSPFPEADGSDLNLRPAMTLRTRLIAVQRRRRGDAIGYGAGYRCPEDMPVGVAAVGYGDGYPRHAPAGTPVLVNGQRAALIGRVSMDMICIDLRAQPDARIGDPVIVWGEGLPVDEVARHAGTISYELLCRVSQRVEIREAD